VLWQRLLFGTLMIAAVGGLATLDGWLSARGLGGPAVRTGFDAASGVFCGLPLALLVMVLVVLGSYELGELCRAGGYKPVTHWAAFVGAGLTIVPWVEMQRRVGPAGSLTPLAPVDLSLTVLWLTGGVLGASLAVLARKTTERAIGNLGATLLIVLYLGLLGSFVVRIRCLGVGPSGSALVAFFILTVKSGDIGAFFAGKLLGKHKLVPWLSPGKTIEGVVGAAVLASLVAVGGMALWDLLGRVLGPPPLSFAQAIVFGLLMAVAGHLGDLLESAIKRDAGIKDSGRIVPAFGGFLDVVDSPLPAAPIAWWLLTIRGPFG